jgi:DNA mismatch repair ATPase MutS
VTCFETSTLLSQLQTVAPRELLVLHHDQGDVGDSSSSSTDYVHLSALRQHFPSCQIRTVVDSDVLHQHDVNAASENLPLLDSAGETPVRLPLQLGLSLLCSLSPTRSSHSSAPLSLNDVACGVLFAYLSHNLQLPVNLATFRMPQPLHHSRFMHIDAHAARALELTRAQDVLGQAVAGGTNGSSGSVLRQLDMTLTAGGSRCMQTWLLRPLVDVESITARQDAVECFFKRPALRRQVRDVLEGVDDVQRCVQKMLLNRATPSDASSLARSLHRLQSLQSTLTAARQLPSGTSLKL